MSKIKKLAGQTALYGLSSIVGRVLNFLLVPFYTSVLPLADFGIYTELYAYVAFLNIVFLFGMETTYFRYSTKDTSKEQTSYNYTQSFVLLTSVVFSGLIILFSQPIASFLQYPQHYDYLIWLGLILFTDTILAIPFARLRLQNRAGRFAFVKLFSIITTISLNIFFLVFCRQIYLGKMLPDLQLYVEMIYVPGYEVGYILLSNLIANALQFPFHAPSFKGFRFSFNLEAIRPMFIYAYPLMFMGLAGMVNEVVDRIMLKFMLPDDFYAGLTSQEAVGVYGACYKLSMFMTLAIQAFRYAGDPFFFSQAQNKNAPALFAKVMKYFIIVCTIIFLGVSVNLDLFGLLLRDESYRQGLMIVPVLLLANLFLGVYYNLSVWFKLTDRTFMGTFLSFFGAGVTILANFLLIPVIGYMGSAVATFICYFLMAAGSYMLGNRYFPVPYNLKSAAFYILLAVALVIISIELHLPDPLFDYGFRFFLILIYLLIVFARERKDFRTRLDV
ncbi:oligosaccharide flippase family protein [Cytophagaceae bacterium ABcell3]|nr:oligosaccharide flippase family protein [Cytophagaceae bacterium ABcell3]